MVRFIVRPPTIKRTPKRLCRLLGARRTAPSNGPTQFDWSQDVFLAYPRQERVLNTDSRYQTAHSFYISNKLQQRLLMGSWELPIVPVCDSLSLDDEYVVRPLNHRSGQGFRIDNSFNPATEYASRLIRKVKEFRVIYYKGQKVSTYLKTNPSNLSYREPWTHSNGCVFHTITQPQNDCLATVNGFYSNLENSPIVQSAHVAAVDVLLDDSGAYISEINLCPGLSVPRTLARIQQLEVSNVQ